MSDFAPPPHPFRAAAEASLPRPKAEHYMPPPGDVTDHAEQQIAFLTEGVIRCMVLSQGTAMPPPPEEAFLPDRSGHYRDPFQVARSVDLRDAARLADASARLMAALARYRSQSAADNNSRLNAGRKRLRAARERLAETAAQNTAGIEN